MDREQKRLNDREYTRNHRSEKKHLIFHGGCLSCVIPLQYGLGNCLGCMYFDFKACGKLPDLGIRNLK